MLSTGQVLDGRYEILAPLAEGGMGAVYRARRTLLGDEVAIKIILGDGLSGVAGARERFMRESRASARLRHPNIVSVFDFNIEPDGHPFLVMELLNGRSLRDELAAAGRMSIEDVRRIVPPLCTALQFAHGLGIVHRDLKPANVVAHEFTPGERVYKLVDFGLANIRETTPDARLTGPHEFIGTIHYAAPEQLSATVVDARSDVYSMGAMVFEMLTGRVPYPGDDPFTVLNGHLSAPVPRPSTLRPDLPAWLDVTVGRALAKSPDDRWADIAEFGRALCAAEGERRTTSIQVSPAASGLLATYELGERIGPGRLGSEVFRGVHRAMGHPVAIRLLRRGGDRNWEGARARFLREAQSLQIAHPSIIQVRDYGEEGGLVYLVTDYIEGSSLRELMQVSGPLEWQRLQRLVAQLFDAAHALHRRKGLLCGLNPDIVRIGTDDEGERVMISSAGVWQASDLLATLQEQTLRGIGLADAELRYVAPELMIGRSADVRSDVFTIGVLLYEMATGALPYDGPSMPALLGTMLRGEPIDPGRLQPTLPEAASAAVRRALRPTPEDRFPTVRAFNAALSSAS